MKYRSIFISDVHLGTKHSKIKDLIQFLKENDCDKLYIVGDLIDGWALKRNWFWDNFHNIFIQKLLRKSRKGCEIFYISGNHDEFLRKFDLFDLNFGGIKIVNEIIHECVDGRKFLVIHGDKFDGILNSFSFISKLGSWLYDVVLEINTFLNKIRSTFDLPYYSFSYKLKTNIKKAVMYAANFEHALVKEAKKQDCQGVICGHSHFPAQKEIENISYNNCGCWVEMASCIVEHYDGRFELIIPTVEIERI